MQNWEESKEGKKSGVGWEVRMLLLSDAAIPTFLFNEANFWPFKEIFPPIREKMAEIRRFWSDATFANWLCQVPKEGSQKVLSWTKIDGEKEPNDFR